MGGGHPRRHGRDGTPGLPHYRGPFAQPAVGGFERPGQAQLLGWPVEIIDRVEIAFATIGQQGDDALPLAEVRDQLGDRRHDRTRRAARQYALALREAATS
jgi:hypothetical protein